MTGRIFTTRLARTIVVVVVVVVAGLSPTVSALSPLSTTTARTASSFSSSGLYAVTSPTKNAPGTGYEPKWKKKSTLADQQGDATTLGFDKVGLKGNIPVVFRTIGQQQQKQKKKNNKTKKDGSDDSVEDFTNSSIIVEEKRSMAWVGQPLRDVASQAGQYIQYGCGKGECGTCECMINGKWVRPCVDVVPAEAAVAVSANTNNGGKRLEPQPLVVQIKAVKSKSKSSGKFFSIRSFIMGFWNNLLGMVGFVKFRRAARKNWEERKAYEELVRVKTIEKRMARLAREATAAAAATRGKMSSGGTRGNGLAHA